MTEKKIESIAELKKAVFDYCVSRHIPPAHIIAYIESLGTYMRERKEHFEKGEIEYKKRWKFIDMAEDLEIRIDELDRLVGDGKR